MKTYIRELVKPMRTYIRDPETEIKLCLCSSTSSDMDGCGADTSMHICVHEGFFELGINDNLRRGTVKDALNILLLRRFIIRQVGLGLERVHSIKKCWSTPNPSHGWVGSCQVGIGYKFAPKIGTKPIRLTPPVRPMSLGSLVVRVL
jgi:hypothetical protein